MTAQKTYELLLKYGQHKNGCAVNYSTTMVDGKLYRRPCTCGFSDALEQSRQVAEREKQTALDELFQ